jgi:hypothetical protein
LRDRRKRIDIGVDSNASGTLDPSEIQKTAYVCNGAQGPAGKEGLRGRAARRR